MSSSSFIRAIGSSVVLALFAAAGAFGQAIVSARSGAIHRVEGQALIDGQVVDVGVAEFPNLHPGSVLKTELGRIEMLLTPGVIFRMGPHSSVRMVSDSLADTQLEFLSGTALIEVMELLDDNAVTVSYNGLAVQPLRAGLYRIDSQPDQFKVYDGRALLTRGDDNLTVKKGKVVQFGETTLVAEKFDTKTGDELYRWASRRSSYLAMANVSSAREYDRMGMAFGSGFVWNPYFGMFTYVPRYGYQHSPFGWTFYSPNTVMNAYDRPRRSFGGSGGSGASGGGTAASPGQSAGVGDRPSTGSGGSSAGASRPAAVGGGSGGGSRPILRRER